ncbi:hypothetical protein F4777DRAFT_448495 [Nemania sp. FL0916]|nr:hypothetical protein F4777DRAFT_448495 [Nemania sp. FL0916]
MHACWGLLHLSRGVPLHPEVNTTFICALCFGSAPDTSHALEHEDLTVVSFWSCKHLLDFTSSLAPLTPQLSIFRIVSCRYYRRLYLTRLLNPSTMDNNPENDRSGHPNEEISLTYYQDLCLNPEDYALPCDFSGEPRGQSQQSWESLDGQNKPLDQNPRPITQCVFFFAPANS